MSDDRASGARGEPGAPHETTEDLLERVAAGDRDAFERLYDRIAGAVLGVARRVVVDPAQAEEVAQEALVEVWQSAHRFDRDRGRASAWVLTVAHRRAVDRVRSAQATSERETRLARLDHAPAYDQVSEAVEARLEREQVHQALRSLTDLQRESVRLAYYGGLTHREVAEHLGVPLGTVKARLRDGMIRLRDALGVA